MKKINMIGFAAAALALMAGSAFAQPMGPGRFPPILPLHELDLTSAQQSDVDVIMNDYRVQLKEAAEALRAAKQSLEELGRADSIDVGAIWVAAGEVGTKLGDLAVIRANVTAAVKQVLTSEQLAELAELNSARAFHFGGGHRGAIGE